MIKTIFKNIINTIHFVLCLAVVSAFTGLIGPFEALGAPRLPQQTDSSTDIKVYRAELQQKLQQKEYNNQRDEQWARVIRTYVKILIQKVRSEHGAPLPVFTKPGQLVLLIENLEKDIENLKREDAKQATSLPQILPDEAQHPVAMALILLFEGRGKTHRDAEDGWYGRHSHRNGLNEIKIILNKALLDKQGLQEIRAHFKRYDFNHKANRVTRGFPPQFVVANDEFKNKVLELVDQAPAHEDYLKTSFHKFADKMSQSALNDEVIRIFQEGSLRVVTDAIQESLEVQHLTLPRDQQAQEVIDVLARLKDKTPILVGASGVGKSTLVEIVAQKFLKHDIPKAKAFQKLKDVVIVETSPSHISTLAQSDSPIAQTAAFKMYFKTISYIEKVMEVPIVVFLDDMHTLSREQRSALRSVLSAGGFEKPVHFIGATTNTNFSLMVQNNESWRRRLQPIQVDELSSQETLSLLSQQAPFLELSYNVTVDPSALEAVVRAASDYDPATLRPEGPYKLLQDVVVAQHRKVQKHSLVTEQDVYLYVTRKLKLPLNPYNMSTFFHDLDQLRSRMHEQVVDQQKMVNAMVDLWGQMFLGVGRLHRVMLVAGPTGSGKTYAAQEFARLALGSESRLLELDATKFKIGSLSLNSLTGVPPGVLGSDQSVGQLPEFLEGPGQGLNIILVNELDKASPDFMEAIMEMLDTGQFQAQNGKTYYLGRSLIIFTTNKGHEYIYPRQVGAALSRNEIMERVDSITDTQIRQWFMEPDDGSLYDKSKQLDPSVLNRIDKAVPAAPPSHEGAVVILTQELHRINKDLNQRLKLKVQVNPKVLEYFVQTVYQPEDGVRDLNNILRAQVTRAIEQAHKEGLELRKNSTLKIQMPPVAPNKATTKLMVKAGRPLQSFLIEGPYKKSNNPLLFSQQRNQLKNIEASLEKHIFGQEEAIASTARSIRTRSLNTSDNKPAVMLYLGTTGTGKTQMAKSLAQVMYGHSDRYAQFDLGKIKWQGDLQNIFGSSQGFVGSEKMSAFEKVLNNFSQGAVLVFDEIGHMGTSAKKGLHASNTKDDMLKVFYSLLDEGKWTNAHGKIYDLSKFIIIFTSSEVSENFQKLPNDDLRMATWKELKSTEKLRHILKTDHDWPEDLLGRMGNRIVLFAPLVEQHRIAVAQKLVHEATKGIREQNNIQNMIFDTKFYKTLIDSFFSHTQGARAMRDFSEGSLVDLIGKVLIDNYGELEKLQKAKWTFKLQDSYTGLISYKGNLPPERKVTLALELSFGRGYRKRHWQQDVTNEAVKRDLVSEDELYAVAIHEAGHAVTNVQEHTGQSIDFITIKAQSGYLGYARYKKVFQKSTTNREDVVHKIARMLAGREAQVFMQLPVDSGWRSDLKEARRLATHAVTTYGLSQDDTESLKLPLRVDGTVNVNNGRVQKEIQALLEQGAARARELIEQNKNVLIEVAQALLENQYLSGAKFKKIQNQLKTLDKSTEPVQEAYTGPCVDLLS